MIPATPHALLADPNLAILLLLCGIFLLYAEFNRPGTIVFGCVGMFLFMLGVHALHLHVINRLALAELLAGIPLLLLELRFPMRGLFATASIGLIMVGLIRLVGGTSGDDFMVAPLVAIFAGSVFGLVTLWLTRIAVLAHHNKWPRGR